MYKITVMYDVMYDIWQVRPQFTRLVLTRSLVITIAFVRVYLLYQGEGEYTPKLKW